MKTHSWCKGASTCTGLQTKPPTAPYSAINANLRKFAGIFRNGADVALMQGSPEHETKWMGSRNMKSCRPFKRCPNLYSPANQTISHHAINAVNANLRKFAGIFQHGADVALMQGAQ